MSNQACLARSIHVHVIVLNLTVGLTPVLLDALIMKTMGMKMCWKHKPLKPCVTGVFNHQASPGDIWLNERAQTSPGHRSLSNINSVRPGV